MTDLNNRKYTIALDQSGGIFPEAMEFMDKFAEVIVPKTNEAEELIPIFKKADAILSWGNTKLQSSLLNECDKIKTIALTGVGYDNVDIDYATSREIVVTNTPGANANAVAEYTIGMIITALRGSFTGVNLLNNKQWADPDDFNGTELKTCVVGIIGLGNIGLKNLARLLTIFGCEVVGYDPYREPKEAKEYNVELVSSLEELCERANVICVHAPLTEETHHMVNEQCFKLMKKGTLIINSARAPIVDEDVLYDFLVAGHIAGYVTDVFPIEPPDLSKPIYSLDNVLATPHIAAMTHTAHREMQVKAAQNIWAVLTGEEPLNIINK